MARLLHASHALQDIHLKERVGGKGERKEKRERGGREGRRERERMRVKDMIAILFYATGASKEGKAQLCHRTKSHDPAGQIVAQ